MKRSGWLRRRTPLRRVSPKRAVELSERAAMLAELRRGYRGGRCAASSVVTAVACAGHLDAHEPLTRGRGGSIVDPENVLLVCRAHHRWLHAHPADATALGLLVPSWA